MSKVTEDTQVYFVVGVKGLTEEVTASLYNELSDSRDMLLLNDLQVSLLLEITNNITNTLRNYRSYRNGNFCKRT